MTPLRLMAASTALAALAASCNGGAQDGQDATVIDKPGFESATRTFDIDALMALGNVGEPAVSPDGKQLLFSITYQSVAENASNADLYVMPATAGADSASVRRITHTAKSESAYAWIDGGERIAFIYAPQGTPQLWVMDADGSHRRQVSDIEGGISGYLFAPDQAHVLLIANVKYSRKASDLYPDLPQATGRIIDDMMYKHWDQWVTEIPHPFVGKWDGKKITEIADIMADEPMYESPMLPFGGIESFAWAPDSKSLVYTSRKKTGRDLAVSTNSDLYLYNLADSTTRNLTEGMMGYDTCPLFSPDGSTLAWLSMERDGYESDKNRIFTLDLATGLKRDLTAGWDYTVNDIAWAPSGKAIIFTAHKGGVTPVFSIDTDSLAVTEIAGGVCDYTGLAAAPDGTVYTRRHSMLYPNEICAVNPTAGDDGAAQLTHVNTELLGQLDMPAVEAHTVATTDGKQMLVWVVKPPHFDPEKKYPAIFYCQGGPQQAVSQFWSARWNFALMASQGYVIIAPNRRGLPGFGTEWNAQISGDYPGQNMRDYLSAADYGRALPYIDPSRVGCTGASYGGFSTYWLAGNHKGRFAAFLAHAGIFNMEAQYLETEEMWFANWDMGDGASNATADATEAPDYGAPWRTDNAVAQRTFACSPHRYVAEWDTPIMISHGEYDYRILSSQGEMAFNAAKLRGIPAEMVIFPDENHWILKPQNAVLWQRLFFRWFDRWLKPAPAADGQQAAE